MINVKIDDKHYLADQEVVDRMGEYYKSMQEAHRRYDELKAAAEDMRAKQKLFSGQPKAFNLSDDAKVAEIIVDRLLAGKPVQETSKQNSMF